MLYQLVSAKQTQEVEEQIDEVQIKFECAENAQFSEYITAYGSAIAAHGSAIRAPALTALWVIVLMYLVSNTIKPMKRMMPM